MGTGPDDLEASALEIRRGYHMRPFPKTGFAAGEKGAIQGHRDPRGIRAAKKEKRCEETDGWEQQKQNLPIKTEVTCLQSIPTCARHDAKHFQRSSH